MGVHCIKFDDHMRLLSSYYVHKIHDVVLCGNIGMKFL